MAEKSFLWKNVWYVGFSEYDEWVKGKDVLRETAVGPITVSKNGKIITQIGWVTVTLK